MHYASKHLRGHLLSRLLRHCTGYVESSAFVFQLPHTQTNTYVFTHYHTIDTFSLRHRWNRKPTKHKHTQKQQQLCLYLIVQLFWYSSRLLVHFHCLASQFFRIPQSFSFFVYTSIIVPRSFSIFIHSSLYLHDCFCFCALRLHRFFRSFRSLRLFKISPFFFVQIDFSGLISFSLVSSSLQ